MMEGNVTTSRRAPQAGGGFDGRAVELVHGGGGDGDLRKPADDGELQERASDAGSHERHGAAEKLMVASSGRGDEGVERLQRKAEPIIPHMASEMSAVDEEVRAEEMALRPVAEAAILSATDSAALWRAGGGWRGRRRRRLPRHRGW